MPRSVVLDSALMRDLGIVLDALERLDLRYVTDEVKPRLLASAIDAAQSLRLALDLPPVAPRPHLSRDELARLMSAIPKSGKRAVPADPHH